jgi:hypothetical protein
MNLRAHLKTFIPLNNLFLQMFSRWNGRVTASTVEVNFSKKGGTIVLSDLQIWRTKYRSLHNRQNWMRFSGFFENKGFAPRRRLGLL